MRAVRKGGDKHAYGEGSGTQGRLSSAVCLPALARQPTVPLEGGPRIAMARTGREKAWRTQTSSASIFSSAFRLVLGDPLSTREGGPRIAMARAGREKAWEIAATITHTPPHATDAKF